MRRQEMARRRRNLSDKRNEEVKVRGRKGPTGTLLDMMDVMFH